MNRVYLVPDGWHRVTVLEVAYSVPNPHWQSNGGTPAEHFVRYFPVRQSTAAQALAREHNGSVRRTTRLARRA